MKKRELSSLQLQQTAVTNEFDAIVSDLLFLSHQNELYDFWSSSYKNTVEAIQAEYIALAKVKRMYDQIRYIDASGVERVRVNYNDGKPSAISEGRLQDKSNRYYFKESIGLQDGEIFISPLDLNIEQQKIEMPLKPMIRFGTPVSDREKRRQGIVVLNYLAANLLERIRNASSDTGAEKMLLNSDGYWLLSPRAEDEWGFMYPDRGDVTFANAHPEEWLLMLDQANGQIQTDSGLYTFASIYPLREGFLLDKDDVQKDSLRCLDSTKYFWVLVSRVSPEILHGYHSSLRVKILLLGAGLFIFSAVAAWVLAVSITKRRIYQARLVQMAQFDALTGLPNRALFFDRLHVALEQAARHDHKLGLLYVDLDGFKEVNDTLGHDAGDHLLVRVAEILRHDLRKSDTVARLGGDEFAIILSQVSDINDSVQVADKLIAALSQPLDLGTSTALIGASIGAAVYPDHETTADALVKKADQAMYQAKSQGKNRCVAAGE